MSVVDTHPIQYLTPTSPSFWRWDGDLVVFNSGTTLAFREEVVELVCQLQPFGLPPLETLLLFLAATRDRFDWEECLSPYDLDLLAGVLPSDWRSKVQLELNKVRRLDAVWKKDLQRKCLVAEVCFEHGLTLLSPEYVLGVGDLLESGFVPPKPKIDEDHDEAARRLALGLRPWLAGVPELDEHRLEYRRKTGLDVPVQGFHGTDLSLGSQVRRLLDDLEGDAEWVGLARLARHLMAAVHVPRALGDPADLPLGGFSDLSNRGALDRLLVSELAQDDLVLSARLALNEALYLRRESPPKNPEQGRLLLIDNGIRLWGMPRLFAVAVALAMEGKACEGIGVECFTPTVHQQLREVRLHTREGLIEALSHLHAHAHPGNALLELAKRSKAATEHRELILVTHTDVFKDPAFESVCELMEQSFYVATVDRRGHYAFYRRDPGRNQVLQRACLNLEEMLEDPGEAARLKRHDVPASLPDIFHRKPFPIRLPSHGLRDRTVFTQNKGVFKSSRDGRLLHFNDSERGGVQVADNLPEGRALPVVEVQGLTDGRHVVAVARKKQLEVCVVDLLSGDWESWTVTITSAPRQLVVTHQQVLVIHSNKVVLHEIRYGQAIAEISLRKRVARCYGDLLLLGSDWYRVGVDGLRPCLEEVAQEHVVASSHMEEQADQSVSGLRKRFRGISLDGTKVILHTGRSNEVLHLVADITDQAFCLRATKTEVEPILFKEIGGPANSRIVLKEAVWPDGSRIILDSRGLLHFVSTAAEVEDFSVILAGAGRLSLWAASFGGVGDPYYFNGEPLGKAGDFAQLMLDFIQHTRC